MVKQFTKRLNKQTPATSGPIFRAVKEDNQQELFNDLLMNVFLKNC